jgi:hypothetical protein
VVTDPVTALTVPDVLRRAESLIAERGLCHGMFEDESGAVCAIGALRVAVAGASDIYGISDDQNNLIDDAIRLLANQVGRPAITTWSDERTEAEVRAALLAAAQRAEAGT